MIVKFDFIWKCPSASLDLAESEAFSTFIEKNKQLQSEGDFLLINLEKIKFVTLLGIISLSSIISRAVAYGFTVTVSLPTYDPAKIFMHYFGFVDILDVPRQIGAVIIPDKILLKKPSQGKKVFSSKPVYSYHDADQFVNYSQIKEWINQLDPEIRESDFFKTGKFARVVSAELGLNIVMHSSMLASAREGRESFGVIAMRVIKQTKGEDTGWVLKSFENHRPFVTKHIKNGFVEVCICDPGQGFRNALESSFKARMVEIGLADAIPGDQVRLTRQIIEFAFDEFGTSKTDQEQWVTDAHALSRILTLVNVYNGILEITTSNMHVVFRLDENGLVRNDKLPGYKSDEGRKFNCPFGTNIRILVPLAMSSTSSSVQKTVQISDGGPEPSIISVATEYRPEDLADVSNFTKRTDYIGSSIRSISTISLLVLDFSNCQHWRSDHFATLVDRLWNLFSGRIVVVVGISPDLASDIMTRCYNSAHRTEQFYIDENSHAKSENIHYLSCLTDLHHVLPALDTEGKLYWFGSTDIAAANICNKILECPMERAEINNAITSAGEPTSSIYSILQSNFHIFYSVKEVSGKSLWASKLSEGNLETLRGKVLVGHLDRHLLNVSDALWGVGGVSAFLLPHSKRYVNTFIEATRLLQEEEFAREVGEVLARLIWASLEKCDPTVIIATTAPSLLLANAIRRWFKGLPLIVDIGHYFDSPKKVVLESLCNPKMAPQKIIVVQDITHSGQSLNEICEALEQYGNKVDAVVALIEFSASVNNVTSGGVKNVIINGKDKKFISLYKSPMPHQLTVSEVKDINEDEIYWVEPYSLHPFKISELKKAGYQYLRGNTPTVALGSHIKKLKDLEENDVLRFGHFAFENHHFSLVTKMLRLFENSTLADRVVDEIVTSCNSMSGELVLIFPLHSHIRYLVPRLLDRLSSRSIKPTHFYPVVARELGQKPYYMIPHRLEKLISSKYEARIKNETTSKLNFVIIDDTTASLRTFETILRSLYLAAVRPVGKDKVINANDIINKMDVWAVINRTGRAKSTFLHSVQNWLDVPFSFHCFAEYDIPVFDDSSCPVCLEYRHLVLASHQLETGSTSSLKQWVDEQIDYLKPVIVDSPSFDSIPSELFPDKIEYIFGNYAARSLPLACLIFLEVAERGCPVRFLISSLVDFTSKVAPYLEHRSVSRFREFVFCWFIGNWKKVASDASVDHLYKLLDDELVLRPKTALKILLSCSIHQKSLPEKAFDEISRKIMLRLTTLSTLAVKSPTLDNMESREIIFNSIILFRASLSVNNLDKTFFEYKLQKWFQDLPDSPVSPGDFQGSMQDVVKAAFTFVPGASVPILECCKLASMELLIPPRRAAGAARIHCNRIYKHLTEIINPDLNDQYLEIITKIKGSVGFLDVRSKLLCFAINNLICGRVGEVSFLHAELKSVQIRFALLRDEINKIGISHLRANEILSSTSFKRAQIIATNIQESIFSKTSLIYREIDAYNVKYWKLFKELESIAKKREMMGRLKLPSPKEFDTHTVFGDDFEVMNFLINHTIDVLYKHQDVTICVEVNEYCDGETLIISIKSHSPTGNARQNIYEGHGFRFERWGLNRFGGEVSLQDTDSESDVTISCRLIHGYV